MLTRLLSAGLFLFGSLSAGLAQDGEWKHATALTGEPKYPAGFAHFDYVNPDAPKGGLVRLATQGGFDSFNPVLGTLGNPAAGLGYLYESLMMSSYDELDISASYGLIAEAMKFPADFSSVTFRLSPKAHWHDGQPITAEDVVWSFEKTVALNPNVRFYYSHVTKAEITGEREVTFTFDAPGNRELPHIMGQLEVMPKHWWEGKDAQRPAARHRQDDARAAARLRPLPDQVVRAGTRRRLRAGRGLLGQGPQRQRRPLQFRRDPLRRISRRDGAAGGLQGRPVRLSARELRQELGDRLRFSRRGSRAR